MQLVRIFFLFATATTILADTSDETKSTADLTPIAPKVQNATQDAEALQLAKRIGHEFAASIMKIRQTENIQDLSKWLLETVSFKLCDNRLQYNQLLAYFTKALLDKEKFPTQLEIDASDAFTRNNEISFVANARGFIFEANDRIILVFEKQPDSSYKLSFGTIMTCRDKN